MGGKGVLSRLKGKPKEEKYQVEEQSPDNPLRLLFQQVEKMDGAIASLNDQLAVIDTTQSQILSCPRNDKEKKMLLDEKLAVLRREMRATKASLRQFELENEQSYKSGLVTETTARIRRSQFQKLSGAFLSFMTRYQESQLAYRDLCKSRIQKQLRIAGVEGVEGDKLEDLVSSHDPQVFTGLIVRSTEEAKAMLSDVEARHSDILRLEEAIREVHDLFVEMDSIVASQQDAFDRIENNVGTAEVKVS